jgi:hypothetical protein
MNPTRAFSALRVLEAFHVRLLLQLADRSDGALYLKGGAPLRPLGLERIQYMDEPAKNTDTTLRFKMGLVIGGGVPEPTKVEISFRGEHSTVETPPFPANAGSPDLAVISDYVPPGTDWSRVLRYPRTSALWQKIRALAYRRQVQARDVFDLHHLGSGMFGPYPYAPLRAHLDADTLRLAEARALEVTREEFEDKVVRYLPAGRHAELLAGWDDLRMTVACQMADIRDGSDT